MIIIHVSNSFFFHFQLKALMDQCDEKDIEIGDIRATLQRNDDKIHTLEKNICMFLFPSKTRNWGPCIQPRPYVPFSVISKEPFY